MLPAPTTPTSCVTHHSSTFKFTSRHFNALFQLSGFMPEYRIEYPATVSFSVSIALKMAVRQRLAVPAPLRRQKGCKAIHTRNEQRHGLVKRPGPDGAGRAVQLVICLAIADLQTDHPAGSAAKLRGRAHRLHRQLATSKQPQS